MIRDLAEINAYHPSEPESDDLILHLMKLPARERLAEILARPDAEAVVAGLPVQDFFLFVQEIGPDDAGPLLALGKCEQLIHLFDIEWWSKDQLQPAKALQWLERLAFASEARLLEWLYRADFELLVSLFKKWIHVVLTPEDVDPLEASEQLPKHTLDDQFFWDTHYVQFEDFLSRLLSLIFEVHPGYYNELMNQVIWGPEAEIEEDAYRFNRGRLEDQAIPNFYDAMTIYRSILREELPYNKGAENPEAGVSPPPSFAMALLAGNDLLHETLGEIHDTGEKDALRLELASLANKVIIADGLALDEIGALRQAMEKTLAYVNLGLDVLSQGDLQDAAKVLRTVFFEHLFRLAHTRVMHLKGRLQKLICRGWLSRWPTGPKGLETDWMEAVERLLQRTPRLVRPVSGPGSTQGEDFFRDRRDLSRVKHSIDVISALGSLAEGLSTQAANLSARLWQDGQITSIEDLTLGIMIWTAAANQQIQGIWKAESIRVDKWSEVFALLSPEAVVPSIRSWVKGIVHDERRRDLIDAYLNPLFDEYAQEMSLFCAANPPDPRLVKFFAFGEAQ